MRNDVCNCPWFGRAILTALGLALLMALALPAAAAQRGVPILLYHRFGPVATDSMVVTVDVFEEQLSWLRTHHYRIIPLRNLVDSLRDPAKVVPAHAVAIVADDGRESIYSVVLPLIRRYRFPVTLFIYPSAISNASYALTWDQLTEMQRTGLVDVQSHTWWHPNFLQERARLRPEAYRAFAMTQFLRSKELIRQHLGGNVDMLAWPFGIHDPELQRWAADAGYIAAFTLVRAPVTRTDDLMALPRHLVTDRDRGARFAAIVEGSKR